MKILEELALGMTILPRPTWPTPLDFARCRFSPPHKGGGAGIEWDYSPAPRGGAEIGLDILDPIRPTLPRIDKD